MSKLEENISGFLIFAFVFEIRPILFPHTLLWGVQATPNQHLLTLPSSSVGKSPGLHTEVQQFNPTQDTSFFFTHIHALFWTRTRIHIHAHTCLRVYVYVCAYMLVVPYASIHSLLYKGAATCTTISDNFFLLSVAVA